MANQESDERGGLLTVTDWILNNPGPSLTIFAVFLFAAFRPMYLLYYGRFGVTPEEIGFDYLGLLITQTSLGLVVIIPVILGGFYARLRLISIQKILDSEIDDPITIRTVFPELEQENDDQVVIRKYKTIREGLLKQTRELSRWYSGFVIIFTLGYLGIAFQSVLSAGTEARNPPFDAFFQGCAIPVVALWVDPSGEASQPRSITYSDLGASGLGDETPDFLLLGNHDGIVMLYDQSLGAVRLPRDKVILVSPPSP